MIASVDNVSFEILFSIIKTSIIIILYSDYFRSCCLKIQNTLPLLYSDLQKKLANKIQLKQTEKETIRENMGLDQYVYATMIPYQIDDGELIGEDVKLEGYYGDDEEKKKREKERFPEFFYWRNHPRLHFWMAKLYEANNYLKFGSCDYNSKWMKIEKSHILKLKKDVWKVDLPTYGFVGTGEGSTLDKYQETLNFCEKALDAMEKNPNLLFYYYNNYQTIIALFKFQY